MIKRVFKIVRFARIAKGITFRVQRPLQNSRGHKTSRNSHRAKRVETIGILDDPRLQRLRRDTRTKAMRFNRVRNRSEILFRITFFA